jgi:hypothetical protein
MNALTLTTIIIRQDAEGRYCLNDLHKASVSNGANERTTEPAKFLASTKTTELVQELQATQKSGSLIEPVKTVLGKGKNQGTFVVKELVQELSDSGNPLSLNNSPISVMRGGSCWVSLI